MPEIFRTSQLKYPRIYFLAVKLPLIKSRNIFLARVLVDNPLEAVLNCTNVLIHSSRLFETDYTIMERGCSLSSTLKKVT